MSESGVERVLSLPPESEPALAALRFPPRAGIFLIPTLETLFSYFAHTIKY